MPKLNPCAAIFVLLMLWPAQQEKQAKKDIPTLTRELLGAVVLVVCSDGTGREIRQGSGFVVSSEGKVVTNYHVVEGAKSAIIKFPNGAFYLIEGLIASDPDKDIAILKASGKDLPFVPLGDSDLTEVGEEVVAIGSPLALEATVSSGIISAIRELKEGGMHVFQTTAPISPGSSGGALFNLRGEVIGITTFQTLRGQNLNFAIPIRYARSLLFANSVAPLSSAPHSRTTLPSASKLPEVWTSLTSGKDFKVRVDGDYIYTERTNLPPELRGTMAFSRSELKKDGSAWVGVTREYWPCWRPYVAQWNWCSINTQMEISIISASRIEGRGQVIVEFDCGKCRPKKIEWRPFVWIPKD